MSGKLIRKVALKGVVVVCALILQAVMLLPHHHHSDNAVACIDLNNCGSYELKSGDCTHHDKGCGVDHSGHDNPRSLCSLTQINFEKSEREQIKIAFPITTAQHAFHWAVLSCYDCLSEHRTELLTVKLRHLPHIKPPIEEVIAHTLPVRAPSFMAYGILIGKPLSTIKHGCGVLHIS